MSIKRRQPLFVFLSVIALILSACGSPATPVFVPRVIKNTPTPFPTVEFIMPTAAFMGVSFSNAIPQGLQDQIKKSDIPFSASMNIDIAKPGDENGTRFQWIYVLVAPFPTIKDGVTSEELRSLWTSGGTPLLMAESTLRAFTATWGEPANGSVRSVDDGQLSATAWKESAWAIIPFEELDPQWKVLTVDGQSPIRKNFDSTTYPLIVDFMLQPGNVVDSSSWALTNYDPAKLTTVIMTGVTGLVRATALTMELKGRTYPGQIVRDIFREADILHVSNEVSFSDDCPYPRPDAGALVFCSNPKNMELFTDIGTDVIELTGNHFADYGPRAIHQTLDLYRANQILYFGGGQDLQDALKPALFESHGNKIAFIGCNKPDTGFPIATASQPGAAPCDFPYFQQKVAELKSQGYVVIFTFQWNESYDHNPAPQQMLDFRSMVEAGASAISGSQAHYPQAMEFYNGAFIHYGLGNLFFDQMGDQDWMPPGIRRTFFDRYAVYNGKLVSIELITAMLEDYSRPRIMDEAERAAFLKDYFYYSGWTALTPDPLPAATPTLTPLALPSLPGTLNLLPSETPSPSP
jgi:hypothetical protein